MGGALCEGQGVVGAVSVGEEEGELEQSLLVAWFVIQHLTQQLLTFLVTPLLQLDACLAGRKQGKFSCVCGWGRK